MAPQQRSQALTAEYRSYTLFAIICVMCLLLGIGAGYMLNTTALKRAEENAVKQYATLMYKTCFAQEKMLGENGQRARRSCNYLKETVIEN